MVRERAGRGGGRPDARVTGASPVDPRRRRLADRPGGRVRGDGGAPGRRRQRDVPRRVRLGLAARRRTSRSARPGSSCRARSRGSAQRFDLARGSRSPSSAARRSGSAPPGSSRGAAARGCRCRCWSCSRSSSSSGFVFIGGQAGRLLDIARHQGELPEDRGRVPGRRGARRRARRRSWSRGSGRTEDLLLATALAQAAFAALVWARGGGMRGALGGRRRRPGAGPLRRRDADRPTRPSLRQSAREPLRRADPRVPGAVGPRQPARRLPRLDRAAALVPGSRGPRRVPRRLHGRHERREHRLPVPARGPAAPAVRAAAGDPRQPARADRVRARR